MKVFRKKMLAFSLYLAVLAGASFLCPMVCSAAALVKASQHSCCPDEQTKTPASEKHCCDEHTKLFLTKKQFSELKVTLLEHPFFAVLSLSVFAPAVTDFPQSVILSTSPPNAVGKQSIFTLKQSFLI